MSEIPSPEPHKSLKPFPDDLQELPSSKWRANDIIETSQSNPDTVIRQDDAMRNLPNTLYASQEVSQRAKELQTAHQELTAFGIRVLNYSVVIGHGDKAEEITPYIVTDRVVGEPVDMILHRMSDEAFNELDSTYAGICQYFISHIQSKRPMLFDIHHRQFMYGHTKEDPVDHVYYVDLSDALGEAHDGSDMEVLRNDISAVERGSDRIMVQTRSEYAKLLDAYFASDAVEEQSTNREDLELNQGKSPF